MTNNFYAATKMKVPTSSASRVDWEVLSQQVAASMSELSDTEAMFLEILLTKIFSASPPGVSSEIKNEALASATRRNGHLPVPGERQSGTEDKPADEKLQAILEERARALARVDEVVSAETLQLVVFALAGETFAVPTAYVREVQPLREVSRVPCTPRFVVGAINIRGAIYSVIDIRSFFTMTLPGQVKNVAEREVSESTKVILVNGAGLELGILADDVLGEVSVPVTEVKSSLAGRAGSNEEYIEGVTSGMLSILNLEALLSDERLIINEEVV